MIDEIYEKAIYILSYSPQLEYILKRKLLKKNYRSEDINVVINQLKEEGFIDDKYYAKMYANELARIKLAGVNKIIKKLMEKGISREYAREFAEIAIAENGGEDDIKKKFIKKKISFFQKCYKEKEFIKIQNKFYQNGFKNCNIDRIEEIIYE